VLHHHSSEHNGLLEVGERSVLVGLGRLQDLLREGVPIIPRQLGLTSTLGQVSDARRGGILCGLVGLLLDDVVVVVFLVGGRGTRRRGRPPKTGTCPRRSTDGGRGAPRRGSHIRTVGSSTCGCTAAARGDSGCTTTVQGGTCGRTAALTSGSTRLRLAPMDLLSATKRVLWLVASSRSRAIIMLRLLSM
jgi:hypothetical protein